MNCVKHFFKRHNVKNIKKNVYKIWRAAFSSKGKACGIVGKELRAQNSNSAAKDRCPSKHVTFLTCLAIVARAEGDCVRARGAPTPVGGGREVSTVHPTLQENVRL